MCGAANDPVKCFKKSRKAATALRAKQNTEGLKSYRLIMEVEARWNSTYCMFQRLIALEWTVRSVLSDTEVVSASDAAHLDMSDSNWALMKLLVPLLEPLKDMTNFLQGTNYPTIALIYPLRRSQLLSSNWQAATKITTPFLHSNRQSSQNWKRHIIRKATRQLYLCLLQSWTLGSST